MKICYKIFMLGAIIATFATGSAKGACEYYEDASGNFQCCEITCPAGYTLGSCPSGKTCDTTTATNDTSKTCYKEKTCPPGYTLGSCPSGERCLTIGGCYRVLTCDDISYAEARLRFKRDVKNGQTCGSDNHGSGSGCLDKIETHEFDYRCTFTKLTSSSSVSGAQMRNDVEASEAIIENRADTIIKAPTSTTLFYIKGGYIITVDAGTSDKAYTNLSSKRNCYYQYYPDNGSRVCTLKDLDGPADGKVKITINRSGSCMAYTQTCSGCGGNGRGYTYNSAVIGVYDTEGNELCEVSGSTESSCNNLEPGTYEVTITSGAGSDVKTYCSNYNDIKGVTVNGTKYESLDSYKINFSAGSYTITPICYTGKGNNC